MNQEERQMLELTRAGIWTHRDGAWLLALVERLQGELSEARELTHNMYTEFEQ